VRRLWLDRTRVTDHGIVAFAETASLRDLDLSWTAVTAPAVDALLAKGTLSRLAVEGLSVSDASLPNLAAAGSMTDLDLARTGAGDQTVAAIVRLPLLERLSIAFSGVTSRGLATLAPSPLLELDARGLKVETETLTALSRMRRLRELQLTLHEDQWESLVAFEAGLSITAPPPRKEGMLPQGLKKLVLTGSLDPGFCRNLGRLQHLEALSVPGGAEHFGEIIGDAFPRLRSLFAESAGLDDVAVDMLGRLPNLEALFLSHNPIAASVVRLSAPLLHTLELRNTPVDDRAVEALARLPRLHCLDLPGTQVTADGIAALVPAARNLQSFALDGGQLTSTVARVLADSTTLVELYLYGPAVTDEVLARIAPLDRLRELNLFGTSLSDLSAPVLIALTGLRTLRIEGSLPSSSFVNGLRTARPDVQLSVAVDPVVARERSRRAFLTSEP
jgi:Leucine-rich repeat (LRR) protein